MTEMQINDSAPATTLFPQFGPTLYSMVDGEVQGLTDQHLDWRSDRWEWSKWNIRRQVSHMACFIPLWLLLRWGDILFPQGTSELGVLGEFSKSPDGSWLDEGRYWALPDLLEKLDHSMKLAQYVLASETVESLREQESSWPNTPAHWSQFANAHPAGVRREEGNPTISYLTLEATFRHLYYETITHLYNVQRLKRAQGLAATVALPYEGYWALPDWDRSEP